LLLQGVVLSLYSMSWEGTSKTNMTEMKLGRNKRKLNSTNISGSQLIFIINIGIDIGVNRIPSLGVNRNKMICWIHVNIFFKTWCIYCNKIWDNRSGPIYVY
jgi:hypothetical protein